MSLNKHNLRNNLCVHQVILQGSFNRVPIGLVALNQIDRADRYRPRSTDLVGFLLILKSRCLEISRMADQVRQIENPDTLPKEHF